MKSNRIFALVLLAAFPFIQGCITYSFTGASTNAQTIQVEDFFNNTDLGPANLGQTFTNRLKEYLQQNSSLRVVSENGELQLKVHLPNMDLLRLHRYQAQPVTVPI